MLDQEATASPGAPEPHPPGAAPEHAQPYIPPEAAPPPLTSHTDPPRVKRFSRRMVWGVGILTAVVVLAAFAAALTRTQAAKKVAESSAQTTAATPTAPEVVNRLPNNYREAGEERIAGGEAGHAANTVPVLGPPLPGDVGAIAFGGATSRNAAPPPPSAYEQALIQQKVEELKRAQKARDTGFEFTGGSNSGPHAADGGTVLPAISRDPGAANQALAGLGRPGADRDADNRQDDKAQFLERDRKERWQLREGVEWPSSPYTMLAGTILPGVLITGINSDLPGQIEGQISQNVYDTVTGQHLLLPQGTRVLGVYDSRVTYGQSRVLIVWTRLIRPDGSNLDLEGMPGVDLSGYAGVTGKVDRHLGRLLTAVVLGSVIEAGAQSGTNYTFPTVADRARQGAGQGVNEATQQIMRKELNLQPTIRVGPGARFNVFATKDIVLPPYQG